ncbi:MAG: hypothetical protein PHW08_13485, partial [Kiritimatiellae bacterium]|nr:hypothetical protein [Kiritimatiellia bacterium]
LTYGAVKKTVAFEAQRNLVTGISYHTVADTLIAERTYTYNALGNVVARTRQRGAGPVEADDFDHNLRSELIAASLGGTNAVSGDYGYAYDPIGNRVVATNRSDVTAYASNELNQYTNIVSEVEFTPAFDDDGNQTLVKTSTGIWHVTYNAENRPVVWSNATAVIAMDYDFMGRRISKHLLSGEGETVDRLFLYDGYLQIAAIETNALVSTTFWDPTERIATRPLAMKTVGGVFTYTHDLTKNVMEVLDSAGDPIIVYDYDAFGAMTASRPYLNRFGFSSEYYDSDLGCIYYNFRHYNPLDGRWTSKDVVEERGSIPLYAFVKNVWRFIDVLGLYPGSNQQCPITAIGPAGEQIYFETQGEAMAFWSSPANTGWNVPELAGDPPPTYPGGRCCGDKLWFYVGSYDGAPCCDESKEPHVIGAYVAYWKRAKGSDGIRRRFDTLDDCVKVRNDELQPGGTVNIVETGVNGFVAGSAAAFFCAIAWGATPPGWVTTGSSFVVGSLLYPFYSNWETTNQAFHDCLSTECVRP